MKLSVLMSVYDKESPANLRQCLDSLAAQTLPADEVVIVEDGPLGEPLEAAIAAYRKILPIVSLPLPSNGRSGSGSCAPAVYVPRRVCGAHGF
jgi:amylovoran biosynthesis glycosyltransferase AmsE